ncbi:MAG: archease [Actinomycetota bacterium]|nr:archease [Actinomycetota bacterium]
MMYEQIEVTGDAGIKASGATLEEAFAAAAEGFYSLLTDTEKIREEKTIEVKAKGDNLESLLVNFLNELVFIFDTKGMLGKKVAVSTLGNGTATAGISGEEFDPERHPRGLLVKAATYHNLKVENKNGRWEVEVIFDI